MKNASKVGEHGLVWLSLGSLFAITDRNRRKAWLVAALTGPLSIVVNFCVKSVVKRNRPERRNISAEHSRQMSFSFPSAHATSSFAAAIVAGRIEPRIWRPAVLLAGCISYSRLYLARHYPADVVAGGVLGLAIGNAVAHKIPGQNPA